jgi:hypothetical protein
LTYRIFDLPDVSTLGVGTAATTLIGVYLFSEVLHIRQVLHLRSLGPYGRVLQGAFSYK